jgi:16S rRNA (cytidine1402-2'-O)-methyltransferase
VGETLADLARAFGADRLAAVCRELTKIHEEVLRGSLAELADQLADGTLGEVTLVVAGAGSAAEPVGLDDAVAMVRERVQAGETTKDAVAAVAAETGLRKRDLYNAVAGRVGPATPA